MDDDGNCRVVSVQINSGVRDCTEITGCTLPSHDDPVRVEKAKDNFPLRSNVYRYGLTGSLRSSNRLRKAQGALKAFLHCDTCQWLLSRTIIARSILLSRRERSNYSFSIALLLFSDGSSVDTLCIYKRAVFINGPIFVCTWCTCTLKSKLSGCTHWGRNLFVAGQNYVRNPHAPGGLSPIDNKTLQWFGASVSASRRDGGPILVSTSIDTGATRASDELHSFLIRKMRHRLRITFSKVPTMRNVMEDECR